MVQASKSEMLLAVDLWNRRGSEAQTTAFVIHAQIALVYLFHAHFLASGVDYYYRHPNGRRIRGDDDQFRTWELQRCLRELYGDADAVRKNVEFFMGIRNKIEHRWERGLGVLVAGRVQSLIFNYEDMLKAWFDESLVDELRFPIFLSSLNKDAGDSIARLWQDLPFELTSYVKGFDESLPAEVADDPRYEFRVALIPQVGSRAQATHWITFLREEELSDEQREHLREVVTIVRDKQVPTRNLGWRLPAETAALIQQGLGVKFHVTSHHVKACLHHKIRPAGPNGDPNKVDARYCTDDAAIARFLYSEAWVKKLIAELADPAEFERVTGRAPIPV